MRASPSSSAAAASAYACVSVSLRFQLYRTASVAVIWAGAALLLAQAAMAQAAPGAKKQVKGPRALGLIEFLPKGKTRLIPVVILVDGEYYDAGSYKADPVPMALDSGTVYEGYKDGVSQGLLTLNVALSSQNPAARDVDSPNNVWLGEGTWETTSEVAAKVAKAKKHESPVPRGYEDMDAPPKLLRHEAVKKPAEAPSTAATTASTSGSAPPSSSSSSSSAAAATSPTLASPSTSTSSSASTLSSPASEASAASGDPNIPVLKRGKVADESVDVVNIPKNAKGTATSATKAPGGKAAPGALKVAARAAKKQQITILPAISDADGPESHSYDFPMKAGEEQAFRTKMLALAAEDVLARDHKLAAEVAETETGAKHVGRHPAMGAQPAFSDVQLRIFDLSSSNEPTIILSATGNVAGRSYMTTIIAREDIYGDLHRAFSSVTDAQHLDVIPQMELIDAVDVDGDGRGELLFRQLYDSGTAYVVYRVIGEQVYPLFQGTAS
jgi:hypothetical protein